MARATVLLVVVALVSCARQSGGDVPSSGIQGRVVRAPTCPVETETTPCPPEGVAATVVIEDAGGEVGRVGTGSDGTFRVDLPPGRYLVRAVPPAGSMLVPVPQRVTVDEGFHRVTVVLDTRLRTP